jgi:hypothetical protein
LGNLCKESIYRLAKKGEIDGYMLCGKRFWTLASLRAYRARQIAKGPQFDPAPVHKRKPGRPKKPPRTGAVVRQRRVMTMVTLRSPHPRTTVPHADEAWGETTKRTIRRARTQKDAKDKADRKEAGYE